MKVTLVPAVGEGERRMLKPISSTPTSVYKKKPTKPLNIGIIFPILTLHLQCFVSDCVALACEGVC